MILMPIQILEQSKIFISFRVCDIPLQKLACSLAPAVRDEFFLKVWSKYPISYELVNKK